MNVIVGLVLAVAFVFWGREDIILYLSQPIIVFMFLSFLFVDLY